MTRAGGGDAPTRGAGEVDGLLDLRDGLRADVELRITCERPCPGLVCMTSGGAKGNVVARGLLYGVQDTLVKARKIRGGHDETVRRD